MSFSRRIRTIYTKELIDILRDRRTLIAMIVVPIVLYPLLMLGAIQAVSFQGARLSRASFIIGVIEDQHRIRLANMIANDTAILDALRESFGPESEEAEALPTPITGAKTREAFTSLAELEHALQNREINVGVVFKDNRLIGLPHYAQQVPVEIYADAEDVRSAHAAHRIEALIERVNERMRAGRLAREQLPPTFFQPFKVDIIDLSSPPSILGQILPLILILMTITGAIYPAIDLTAGERERGTLESLMVCPVPVIDLVVGKFLVVTTVAIMGATLNLASVTATVYAGGFDQIMAKTGGTIPVGTLLLILLCLIPFAVLMSAIMIAVCSYARTFKEAQNYVTPVILAVLIPGGIAALPTTRLDGIMLVMPVGNMVLLARDLLMGANVPLWILGMVLISTMLYAGTAVVVAATVFGQESVVFSDSGSLKSVFQRSLIKPARRPSLSMGSLVVALLFPTWFFIQSIFSPGPGEDATDLLYRTGYLMPLLFVLVPMALLAYWKTDIAQSLALRLPSPRFLIAGVLIGLSAWIPAHELNFLQAAVVGIPETISKSAEIMGETIKALPLWMAIVLIALVPAVCEELLFRGFFLSSLSATGRKWVAIGVSATVFGVFHFLIFRFAVTMAMGVLLGYLCWQSRSILPGMIAHLLHNTLGVVATVKPTLFEHIGIDTSGDTGHLPIKVIVVGVVVLLIGLSLMRKSISPPSLSDGSSDTSNDSPRGERLLRQRGRMGEKVGEDLFIESNELE